MTLDLEFLRIRKWWTCVSEVCSWGLEHSRLVPLLGNCIWLITHHLICSVQLHPVFQSSSEVSEDCGFRGRVDLVAYRVQSICGRYWSSLPTASLHAG